MNRIPLSSTSLPFTAGKMVFAICIACCSCGQQDPPSPEMKAIRHIANLCKFENQSYAEFGQYVGLSILNRRYPSLNRDEIGEYRIELQAAQDHYQIRAIPIANSGARRSFYCDQSGIIRQSWNSEVADSTSPPLR
jgi:hypothetical protein